eukprot:TRINITY_DN10829_c2_g1_i1.p1 TRINITY_DN10829_c2_g1~~TRINITY_DN10829_c2_g1_i1.p1  ORF type:complete len:583 (-),score=113.08 TRINITY_DN10829_c2_g1_i1:100-1848(-)
MAYGRSDRLVIGLIQANGRTHNDDELDLESIAERTLQKCAHNDKGMKALDISNTLFTSNFLTDLSSALGHNSQIIELFLDNCRLGDEGLRIIVSGLVASKSNSLKALSLDKNEIKCIGLSYLTKVIEARSSRWSRTFGGYQAPSVGPSYGLRYLSLKDNEIGAIGSKSLAEVLMASDDSLETLNLEGNKICDWGAGWLANVLRHHDVLQSLNLQKNPIGTDGLDELRGACITAEARLQICPAGAKLSGEVEPLETQALADAGNVAALGKLVYVTAVQAISRPTSAARSRPSSAARSRPSSASSHGGSTVSGAYSRPGSASKKIPVTVRRSSSRPQSASSLGTTRPPSAQSLRTTRPPSAQSLGARSFSGFKIAGSGEAEFSEDVQKSPTVTAAALDVGVEKCSEASAGSPSRPRSPCKTRTDFAPSSPGLMRKHVRSGKINPHWPPHPLAIAKARRRQNAEDGDGNSNAELASPLTFTSPSTRPAAMRLRASERGVGADETETTTVLAPASRWRWKPRGIPDNVNATSAPHGSPAGNTAGCGVRAVRGLRRSCSAPGIYSTKPMRRHGALMGPSAAVAMMTR